MRQLVFWLVLAGVSFVANWSSGQSTVRMTPETLWKLGRLGSATIDPSGERIAFAVRRFDLAENNGRSELHVIDLRAGTERVALDGWSVIDSIQFVSRPEGLRLFFIGMPGGSSETVPQVWSLNLENWQVSKVTTFDGGAGNLKVATNGKRLAYTRQVKLDPTVNDLYTDLPKANARIIDNLMYRHWDAWHDFSYSHVFVADLGEDGTAKTERDLMEGRRVDCPVPPFGGAEQFDWSPDGNQLALTVKIVDQPARSTDTNVYLLNLDQPSEWQLISPEMPGYDNDPIYSPDGRFVVFHSMERPGFEADRNRLILYSRDDGTVRELTENLDANANHATWLPDSSGLVFVSESRGTEQIFRLKLDDGRIEPLTEGRYNWNLVGIVGSGKQLLVSRQDMLRPAELFVLTVQDRAVQRVSTINDELYATLELPVVEERWVEATDGAKIHCWVVHPPDFDGQAGQHWPMILFCQGGPQSQVSQAFSYRWNFHLMAARGYVVVAPNRRGLPGFGQAWNDQISRDWGGQAMRDLLSVADNMATESYIDRRRLAAVGASFGGYSVYWLMGNHAGRFCTMIAHCGVFNLESMYGSTEELFFVDWDLGGPYWASDQIARDYQRFSPHRFVQRWQTPLLVIHGERDFRVPVTQGMEAFTAAQVQGVPSRFLYFPDEGHWVVRPQNSVLWQRVFFDWLDRHCKSNDNAAPDSPRSASQSSAGGRPGTQ